MWMSCCGRGRVAEVCGNGARAIVGFWYRAVGYIIVPLVFGGSETFRTSYIQYWCYN